MVLLNIATKLDPSGAGQFRPSIHCAGETCSHLNHAKDTVFKGISIFKKKKKKEVIYSK